jgi:hypothetical protein
MVKFIVRYILFPNITSTNTYNLNSFVVVVIYFKLSALVCIQRNDHFGRCLHSTQLDVPGLHRTFIHFSLYTQLPLLAYSVAHERR